MALPFVDGPLDGQVVTREMLLTWDLDGSGLVWSEWFADGPLFQPLDPPPPAIGVYSEIIHRYSLSEIIHRYILKCRGEFLMSNCWLEYVGVVS
jgi:hypothetical protein